MDDSITQDIIRADAEGIREEIAARFAAARRESEDRAVGLDLEPDTYRVGPWWERLGTPEK